MTELKLPQRRWPLAVMVTLGLQTAAGLMWVGAANERLASVEHTVETRAGVLERLARVEVQTEAIRSQLARMESKLDSLNLRSGRDG